VIQNGSDLTRFDPDRTAPPALRAELGIEPSDPVVMVVGRLEPQKGHAVLFDALPEVTRRFPSVQVVCLGEGSLRPLLEEQVRRLGLTRNVHLLGRRSNPETWLALADFTVLPSFYEGLPLVAIESLAAGRPVVATDVDGTPEVVLDGVTGRTVPPGNAPALAAAIGDLLSDPARRQAMGRRGRAWVEERFSETRQIADTSRFYLEAWASSTRRRRTPHQAATSVRPVEP
jgi:glycosyltransferase involved in cell wall biosynthesis